MCRYLRWIYRGSIPVKARIHKLLKIFSNNKILCERQGMLRIPQQIYLIEYLYNVVLNKFKIKFYLKYEKLKLNLKHLSLFKY